LSQSFTYADYRNHVTKLLKDGFSTGNEQTTDLLHYSELNEVRMNRLDKTIKISIENIQKLQALHKEYIWLVISEGWCGDAAQILPIIHKMTEHSNHIELKIVLRDENEALMDLFLTNGAKAIPKLIVIDKCTLKVLGDFGPRPQGAKQLILDYKQKHGVVDETAKTDLQLWYLHDKGMSTQNKIMDLMISLEILNLQNR
jgi:Thioredoxin